MCWDNCFASMGAGEDVGEEEEVEEGIVEE